eukprot:15345043-Ditylum_brightwellii.AAC.1
MAGPMYQALSAWNPHDARLLGLMCISAFVPGGAISVDSKWNSACIATCADNAGMMRHSCNTFSVMFACGIKLHQKLMENSAGTLARPARK